MCRMALADWLYKDCLTSKVRKQRDINQIDLMALMWQSPSFVATACSALPLLLAVRIASGALSAAVPPKLL